MKRELNITNDCEMIGFLYSIYTKEWLIDCATFDDFINLIAFELTERNKEVLKIEWDIKEEIISTKKKFNNNFIF
jgi:hypothetical protein